MRITALRHIGAGSVIARFNLVISDDMTILDMQLKRNHAGHYRVYPPNAGRKMLLSMSQEISATLTRRVLAEMEGERLAAA